jgi:hypothetical protein
VPQPAQAVSLLRPRTCLGRPMPKATRARRGRECAYPSPRPWVRSRRAAGHITREGLEALEKRSLQRPRVFYRREPEAQPFVVAKP